MACRYTVLLRYDDQRYYLAPRHSISLDEGRDFESVDDSSECDTCGVDQDRTWKFLAHFTSCDLYGAQAMYNSLTGFLEAACASDLVIERRVCNEPVLVYKVKKARARMGDTLGQRLGRPRLLSMELTFELTTWIDDGDGVVLVG
jgi:hypothetical protein